ncbi:hypothetical protein [Nordella sp. HKS 07]|nr:hypothetical protein [Nordella sp. HKS 07]
MATGKKDGDREAELEPALEAIRKERVLTKVKVEDNGCESRA